MQTILVPLDGSALAEQVLPIVRQLAPVLNARVRLLRIVEALEGAQVWSEVLATQTTLHTPMVGPYQVQATQRILHEQASAYLAARISAFRGTSIDVDYEVRVGNPAEVIVGVAAHEPTTLIALATHGYSGLRRWALGSVSDKVAQTATVPVLLVRDVAVPPVSERPIRRILVPLDGSKIAQRALPLALDLARQADAQIVLVTAINPHTFTFAWPDQSYDETLHRLQATATALLDTLAVGLREESVSVRTVVAVGSPAEVILNEAAEQHADVIVMATHGYTGSQRWALGSVADKVLHASTTPLLLVRTVPGKDDNSSIVLPQATVVHTTSVGETPI